MIEFTSRENLQPSLLDRLTDNAPDRKVDPPDQQSLTIAQLRASVLRDLSWLFSSTRLDALESLSAYPNVTKSVVNYGLPGFTGANQTSNRIRAIETAIADTIRFFEPRILPDTVRVRLRESSDLADNGALLFEIQGEMWAQPVPVRIVLETAIDPATAEARVAEARAQR